MSGFAIAKDQSVSKAHALAWFAGIGFIMPSEEARKKIEKVRDTIDGFRPDQLLYMQHLMLSWGIFSRPLSRPYNGIDLTYRAMKRTLQEKP